VGGSEKRAPVKRMTGVNEDFLGARGKVWRVANVGERTLESRRFGVLDQGRGKERGDGLGDWGLLNNGGRHPIGLSASWCPNCAVPCLCCAKLCCAACWVRLGATLCCAMLQRATAPTGGHSAMPPGTVYRHRSRHGSRYRYSAGPSIRQPWPGLTSPNL
jgi:hypothetical protein